MRRIFLNNLALLLMLSAASAASAALQPTFIVLTPSADINAETARLESQGVQIRQSVPPRILVADIPSGLPLSSNAVLRRYVGAVPLGELSPYGPLAVAAGINWNRHFVTPGAASAASMGTMSAMRAMVAKESLPAPQGVSAVATPNGFRVSWSAVPAALYYHVQVSKDADFTRVLYETRTGRLAAEFPRPESTGLETLHLRVRGADRPDSSDRDADLFGRWSNILQLSASGATTDASRSAPELTSPVDALTAAGFTIVLEWTGDSSRTYRLQVSRSADFSTTLIDELVPYDAFAAPSAAMHVGDTFFWRVRESGDRVGPWSSSRRFTIGEPRHEKHDVFVNPEAPK